MVMYQSRKYSIYIVSALQILFYTLILIYLDFLGYVLRNIVEDTKGFRYSFVLYASPISFVKNQLAALMIPVAH